ncbi:MAG: type II secretion system inner membrane protein GspF [Gammaproteobacteria bacterium]|nr:type II secretion system inner membrane protein GspF [Gammaproteobacteria bacterium]MDH5276193.1 type II secretion system inner membrane protein GspF [Gammaproteobacteria bacterium]
MGAFEYTAVDASGKESRGVLEGDTARQVRQLLRERQLLPLTVAEVAESEATRQKSFTLRPTLSASDLALVTRQLATLVQSSLPLEEALLAVSEQTESSRVKSILIGVRSKVMEGHTLADGFGDFPKAFPEIYRATVSAGEQSGHLDAVLERLADYTEGRQVLRQKIQHAMIYPVVLTVLALLIVSGMLVYVVPKVVGVFSNTGRELPGLTIFLIALSDFLRDYGLYLLIALIAAGFAARRALRRPGPRRWLDAFLLRIPLVAKLVRGSNTARFTRTLSILTGSGVPVLEALRISAAVVTNVPMREAVEGASDRVREGAPIGKSLAVGGYFPPLCVHLISSGEASGELETMLSRAAVNQEREMDGLIAALLGILEPALIVSMGVIVLIIVLAILLPIFELNQLVG